ncbi:MAG: 23S rRNA (pseudouridine(1915)-N(3))-methyltransferase RlmH [Eubacteriaceae bacterium]|nr:23S rRNA (pseudouridine(1915)-N(3))-methyltransferase RlmH [Eubacteriaceae bacterium]
MIRVLAVGKIKEGYIREGIADYLARISKFDKIQVVETKESNKEGVESSFEESKALLASIQDKEYSIALDIEGKQMDSLQFAAMLKDVYVNKSSNMCFIIGGSNGLDREMVGNCDIAVSFSKMTFPHQLFRLVLLEQIYRAFKINNNQMYHK